MPDVVYLGPSDNLLLKEGGKEYHPGDTIRLSAEALGNLVRAGMRFAHAHNEAEAAAIEAQVHPPVFVPPTELVTMDPEPDPVPVAKAEPHATEAPKKEDK